MLIFNTTYHIENGLQNSFIEWLKTEYIPLATKSEALFNPSLSKVLAQEDAEGECYALQFNVHNSENLVRWYDEYGNGLNKKLTEKFSTQVAGFSTVLQKIDIE